MTQEIDIDGAGGPEDYSDEVDQLMAEALEEADTYLEYLTMAPDERDCRRCGEVFEPDYPHEVLCLDCCFDWLNDYAAAEDGEGAGRAVDGGTGADD